MIPYPRDKLKTVQNCSAFHLSLLGLEILQCEYPHVVCDPLPNHMGEVLCADWCALARLFNFSCRMRTLGPLAASRGSVRAVLNKIFQAS